MAIKLSSEELAVVKAYKSALTKGDLSWIQTDKEHTLDVTQRGNIRAFMYEKGIDIFKGMTSIPTMFFGQTKLKEVTIPDTIISLEVHAFAGSHISSIIAEDGLESVGNNAFELCAASTIVLPNSVTHIGDNAFLNCTELKEIMLPDGVTEINADMFSGDGDINIWANKRKGANRLKCPAEDIEWFKQHLYRYEGNNN